MSRSVLQSGSTLTAPSTGAITDAQLPVTAQAATLSATFVPKWKATTAYLAGDKVLNPSGDVVSAIANHTSGSSYNAANWNMSPVYSRSDAGAALFTKLDTKSGDGVIVLLGDSTANSPFEWFEEGNKNLVLSYPEVTLKTRLWNDSIQAYDAETVVQTGTGTGSRVTTARDTFTRTDAELAGDIPDTGGAWTGPTGGWATDGSSAYMTAGNAGTEALVLGVAADKTNTRWITSITTLGGSGKLVRFWTKYLNSSNYIFAEISVTATTTTLALFKKIGGTNTAIATAIDLTSTIPAAAAAVAVTVDLEILSDAVTLKINGITKMTGTLAGSDVTALATATRAGFQATLVGTKFDDVQLETLQAPVLTVYNGSMPGAAPSYFTTGRVALMVPVRPALLVFNLGHNSDDKGEVFGPAYEALISSTRDLFPATTTVPQPGVIVSSQNPRKTPATNPTWQFLRMAYVRSMCKRRGWGYLPVIEAFMDQPDPYVLVLDDGIHPTTSTDGGSTLWRDVYVEFLRRNAAYGAGYKSPASRSTAAATTQRPVGIVAGTPFFDVTINKPIWYNGGTWVDATGATA